jgi:hypothetical protein
MLKKSSSQIMLEKLRVGIQELVPEATLRESLSIATYMDVILRSMVVSLRGYVLAEEVAKTEKDVYFEFEIPANWWEHFKATMPHWFLGKPRLKRVTARKQVRFRKLAAYPKANIDIPELGDPIIRYRIEEL